MVNGERLNDGSLIYSPILEGPNTIISIDRVVSKINKGLRSNHISEDDIVLVFKVIGFIVLAVRVNNRISVVKCEIEEA
jgi:hypothetical protein